MAGGLKASENGKFQMLALWYSIDQKFHADDENTFESQFWAFVLHCPDPVKVPKDLKKGLTIDFQSLLVNFEHINPNGSKILSIWEEIIHF
jgi:hypothetical protein